MQEKTKMIRVWPDAHKELDQLCKMLAQEKGVKHIAFTDAASIAIMEAIQKREPKTKKAVAA